MCPPGYHQKGFVASHALGHMMCMSCHKVIVVITERAYFFHDYMYILPILLLRDRQHSVCRGSLMHAYDHLYINLNIYTYIFVNTRSSY